MSNEESNRSSSHTLHADIQFELGSVVILNQDLKQLVVPNCLHVSTHKHSISNLSPTRRAS